MPRPAPSASACHRPVPVSHPSPVDDGREGDPFRVAPGAGPSGAPPLVHRWRRRRPAAADSPAVGAMLGQVGPTVGRSPSPAAAQRQRCPAASFRREETCPARFCATARREKKPGPPGPSPAAAATDPANRADCPKNRHPGQGSPPKAPDVVADPLRGRRTWSSQTPGLARRPPRAARKPSITPPGSLKGHHDDDAVPRARPAHRRTRGRPGHGPIT